MKIWNYIYLILMVSVSGACTQNMARPDQPVQTQENNRTSGPEKIFCLKSVAQGQGHNDYSLKMEIYKIDDYYEYTLYDQQHTNRGILDLSYTGDLKFEKIYKMWLHNITWHQSPYDDPQYEVELRAEDSFLILENRGYKNKKPFQIFSFVPWDTIYFQPQ